MKQIIFLITFLLNVNAFSQSVNEDNRNNDSTVSKWIVKYDPEVLRIPGNKLEVGVSEKLGNGTFAKTRGYLNGKVKQ